MRTGSRPSSVTNPISQPGYTTSSFSSTFLGENWDGVFYVDNILKSFVETCSAKRGELKAELTSAKDLTEDEVNSIKEELTENFSSKIKLNYKYDKSLIGGLIVQVGSTMVDTSIKNKLQQIENRMIEA